MTPTLIKIVRARFCFAGAMAAPEGLEAANPVVGGVSAAAVPTGLCIGLDGVSDWVCCEAAGEAEDDEVCSVNSRASTIC